MKTIQLVILLFSLSLCGCSNNSKLELARKYYQEKQFKEAFDLYLPLAEKDNPEAQFYISVMSHEGEGRKKDLRTALVFLLKSAKQNYPKAQFRLGTAYYLGNLVEKDYETAFKYFQKASEQDLPEAQFAIAEMYKNGIWLKADKEKAIKMYYLSAKNGYGLAQFIVSIAYLDEGKDETAKKWIEILRKNDSFPVSFWKHFGYKEFPPTPDFKNKILGLVKNAAENNIKLGKEEMIGFSTLDFANDSLKRTPPYGTTDNAANQEKWANYDIFVVSGIILMILVILICAKPQTYLIKKEKLIRIICLIVFSIGGLFVLNSLWTDSNSVFLVLTIVAANGIGFSEILARIIKIETLISNMKYKNLSDKKIIVDGLQVTDKDKD